MSAEQPSQEPGAEQKQPVAKAEQSDLARELSDIVQQRKSETAAPDPASADVVEREKTKAHKMLTAARDKLRAIHGGAESPDAQAAAAHTLAPGGADHLANTAHPEAQALSDARAEAVQRVVDAYNAKEAELPEGDVALRTALREQATLAVKAERARQEEVIRSEARRLSNEVRDQLFQQDMANIRAEYEAELADINRAYNEERGAGRVHERPAATAQPEVSAPTGRPPATEKLVYNVTTLPPETPRSPAASSDQSAERVIDAVQAAPEAQPESAERRAETTGSAERPSTEAAHAPTEQPQPAPAARSEVPADGAPLSADEEAAFNDIVAHYDQTAVRPPAKEPTASGPSAGAGAVIDTDMGHPSDLTPLTNVPSPEATPPRAGSASRREQQRPQQPKAPWWQRLFRRGPQQQKRPPRR
ncbi:MAG TPA: hypothetical protein VLI05_05865 [Candidatus Saccharimonadia bacterium]|nr:hypothetical protein [Candidatus Saccharimonadia bacterium]